MQQSFSPQLFVCIDCETTGLDAKKDQIIEVAVIVFSLYGEIDRFESLVNPGCTIPADSIAIHHITDDMVKNQPSIITLLPRLLDLIGCHPIVGHGIQFDVDLLINACEKNSITHQLHKNQQIDTLRMARLYGDCATNSLEQLGKHFNLATDGNHRAMNDVEINIGVFKQLFKFHKNLAELLKILEKPILMKTMPLGKHKGRPIKELPPKYLEWAAGKDFDRDLLYSLRSEIKRRRQGGGFAQAANPFSNL